MSCTCVVFCFECGSHKVDVNHWECGRAVIVCYNCGNRGELDGFTLGRAEIPFRALSEARDDAARLKRTRTRPHAL